MQHPATGCVTPDLQIHSFAVVAAALVGALFLPARLRVLFRSWSGGGSSSWATRSRAHRPSSFSHWRFCWPGVAVGRRLAAGARRRASTASCRVVPDASGETRSVMFHSSGSSTGPAQARLRLPKRTRRTLGRLLREGGRATVPLAPPCFLTLDHWETRAAQTRPSGASGRSNTRRSTPCEEATLRSFSRLGRVDRLGATFFLALPIQVGRPRCCSRSLPSSDPWTACCRTSATAFGACSRARPSRSSSSSPSLSASGPIPLIFSAVNAVCGRWPTSSLGGWSRIQYHNLRPARARARARAGRSSSWP